MLRQPKRLALFVYLALARPRGFHRRDKLLALFWPELDEDRARHALRQSLYYLRSHLGDEIFRARGDGEIAVENVESDVASFEAALPANPERALSHYHGDFLTGFHAADVAPEFEDWVAEERDRLQRLAVTAAWEAAERAEERADREAAGRLARRAIALAPADETGFRRMLSLLSRLGDRAAAMAAYESFCRRLREQYEIEPSAETRALVAAIRHADVDSGVASAVRSPAGRGAVPAPAIDDRESGSGAGQRWSTGRPLRPGGGRSGRLPRGANGASPSESGANGDSHAELWESVPAPESAVAELRQALRRRRSWKVGAAAAIAVIAVATTVLIAQGGSTPSPSLETRVAIMPFAVRGERENQRALSEGMMDLLSTTLDGAGDLRSVDPSAVLAGVGDAPSLGEARRAAQRLGADLIVLGQVLVLDGRLQMTASMYDVSSDGEAIARAGVEGRSTEVLRTVDRLAVELLSQREGTLRGDLSTLTTEETSSVAALKVYLDGERLFRRGDFTGAARLFREATDQDSMFALAYYRLSVAESWSFHGEESDSAALRASRYLSRLPARERQLLRARLAYREGDAQQAERLSRALVASYPNAIEAWLQLGEVLVHFNPLQGRSIEEATPAFQRALSLDAKTMEPLYHLTQLAAYRGAWDQVGALAREGLRLSPTGQRAPQQRLFAALAAAGGTQPPDQVLARLLEALDSSSDFTVISSAYNAAVYSGRMDTAVRIAVRLDMAGRSPAIRAFGRVLAAELEFAQGHWRAARAELRRAQQFDPLTAAEYSALMISSPWLQPSREELTATRTDLLRAFGEVGPRLTAPAWLGMGEDLHNLLRPYLAGLLSVRLGDSAAVAGYTAELRQPGNGDLAEAYARILEVELAQGSIDLAAAARDIAPTVSVEDAVISPFYSLPNARFMRARLLSDSQPAKAMGLYQSLYEFSIDGLMYAAPAHLEQGRIAERSGASAEAARHYQAVLDLWSDADPELRPAVETARRRLAGLSLR